MTRARDLYDWIDAWYAKDPDKSFVHANVAEELGLPGREASYTIEAYLRWQNRKDVSPAYVIHRKAGTRATSTVWIVGAGAADARDLGAQLGSDVRVRVQGAVRPTLATIARQNPRAKRQTDALENAIGSIVELLVATFAVDLVEEVV